MDVLTYARQLMIAQAKALGVDVLEPKHRDLPPEINHADPDMDTEELCAVVECQLAKMAKALGYEWYSVIGDVRCLVERARALAAEKEQGFF
jgi:hypothetical protein